MGPDLTPPAAPPTLDLSGLPDSVVRDLRQLVDTIRATLGPPTAGPAAAGRKPLAGRLAHLVPRVPSLEEFQEARRETWAGFPRDRPDPARP